MTSRKTGTKLFCNIGLIVVGKPEATVITSSPFSNFLFPIFSDVRQESAIKLADEPELTVEQNLMFVNLLSFS